MSTRELNRPSEDFDFSDSPRFSDRPSYLPEGIEDEMIPGPLKEETQYWTTGKGQKLSEESAYALMEAEAIMTGLLQSGTLEAMGLNPYAPKHQSLNGHGTRVAVHTLLINDHLTTYYSPSRASDPRVLAVSGLLHDIGKLKPEINKVVMSDAKWGEEALMAWEIIKQHPEVGAEIAYAMPGLESGGERIRVANAIYQHHENYDGTGYHRIKGKDICPEARIIRLADAIDAMGEPRPYKDPMAPLSIMAEIEKNHRMYDPEILVIIRKIRRISGVFSIHRNSDRP